MNRIMNRQFGCWLGSARLSVVLMGVPLIGVLLACQVGIGQDEKKLQRIQIERIPNFRGAIEIEQLGDGAAETADERARKSYVTELQVRLDELLFACELTPAQQKKLKVGLQGIAEKLITRVVDPVAGVRVPVPANLAADQIVVEFAADQGFAMVRQGLVVRRPSPRMEFLWNDLTSKVLTEPQKEKLKAARLDRAKHVRKTNVAVVVVAVDSELLLQAKQREELTKLLDRYVGGIFEKATMFNAKVPPTANFIRKIPDEALEKLLTPSQLKAMQSRWRTAPQTPGIPNGELQDVFHALPDQDIIEF